ncbi:hypothetical protein C8N32_104160 [Rhodovulum imhoffii]|uniref:Uncharacterized protein n=1 Tax=Rhodovulum imhoffii TaxID=365340 RepID=A0A2T5BUB1_9RHOB|nr:hypothetical protein [Rhodovulum imhoffii]MBK5934534.1 hypothetical protein [Rhodovulum imhoffii]PTN03049.1 hypothetical protein C8N32_104160 [Rhodovulum imhoffii]
MLADLCLVFGAFALILSVPGAILSWADGGSFLAPGIWFGLGAVSLLFAVQTGNYTLAPTEVPDAIIRIIARIVH